MSVSVALRSVFVQQEYAESSPRQDGNFGSIEVMDKKHVNGM